jgi:hypothetical protein
MSLRRKLFYGFTLVVVAALVLLPATGWLARMQLFPFTRFNAFYATNDSLKSPTPVIVADEARFVASRPGDFDLQFAHAMNGGSDESLTRLEALDKTFPNNPAVIAARLTRMTADKIRVRRAEEDWLLPPTERQKKSSLSAEAIDPAVAARFVALAEQGERLEPTNGFFSAMTALGNFARSHDAEAVAAWKRAGAKNRWVDYTLFEVNARWKLQRERNGGGEVGFMPRMGAVAGIFLPHYAALRASARMATVKAVKAELGGDREEGIAVRAATRHIGAAMMQDGEILIGALVGRAIVNIAAIRPGGAEAVDTAGTVELQKNRRTEYVNYLRSVSHPEEARAFAAAIAGGDAIRRNSADAMDRTYHGFGEKTFRLFSRWYADMLLLAGVLSSLAFAGIFQLVYKFSPRLQQGEVLQTSARWGLMLGLAIPSLIAVATLTTTQYWADNDLDIWAPSPVVLGSTFAVGVMLLVGPPIVCQMSWKAIGHGLLVMLATAATLPVFGAVAGATWYMFAGPINATGLLQSFAVDGSQQDVTKNLWAILIPTIISLVMLSLPLVFLAAFAGFSRMLRIPVAAGVTRGMRAMAVPLACVLLLGWAVCLVFTLKHENAAIAELKRMGQVGEPRMQAELLGREYPAMAEALRIP